MKNFLKSKLHRGLFFALCATFLCCAIFAFTNIFVINKSAKADATATAGSADVVSYRISGTCAQMEAGWVAAVKRSVETKSQVKIILGSDWVAASNSTHTTSFGSTATYFSDGHIFIVSGMNIILDLNGYKIDRGLSDLSAGVKNGRIFDITGGSLTIEDSSVAKSGVITGGNVKNGGDTGAGSAGGAIYISRGALTINSGTISGNKATGHGGAIGSISGVANKLIINGGFITGNTTGGNGTIHNYGDIEFNGGVITGNTGDGIYSDTDSRTNINGGSITNNSGHGIVICASYTT